LRSRCASRRASAASAWRSARDGGDSAVHAGHAVTGSCLTLPSTSATACARLMPTMRATSAGAGEKPVRVRKKSASSASRGVRMAGGSACPAALS